VYLTSSIIGWTGFVTVYTRDVAVLGLSETVAGEVVFRTFHTSGCVPAVVFCVSVFLAAHALEYFSF